MRKWLASAIIVVLLATLAFALFNAWQARVDSRQGLDAYENDIAAVHLSRESLAQIIRFMEDRPDLFPARKLDRPRVLDPEQRAGISSTWAAFLDHILALDSQGQAYADQYRQARGHARKAAFTISHAIFLAQYRYALEFIGLAENDPSLHVVLNEPLPSVGLGGGSYARLKYRFLNVIRGAEFARLGLVSDIYGDIAGLQLNPGMREDSAQIWKAGKGQGPSQTAQNALQIIGDLAMTAWFPVQKGVSQRMSEIKVARHHESLITRQQILTMAKELEPGDIMLQRREWYMTNVGLPGFWTHAALYTGTAEERAAYFDDPEVHAWLTAQGMPASFEQALSIHAPDAYRMVSSVTDGGDGRRVIEALGEGVIFTALEDSAAADSVAVLRPRLTRAAKARALLRAFGYAGRPYDFNFDFRSEEALVCTELVYKAYQADSTGPGLVLPLSQVLGRAVTSANDIAALFANEHGSGNRQFELAYFLDGIEGLGESRLASVDDFLDSWTRPKWHVLVQDGVGPR